MAQRSIEQIDVFRDGVYYPTTTTALLGSMSEKDADRLRRDINKANARRRRGTDADSSDDAAAMFDYPVRCTFCRRPVYISRQSSLGGSLRYFQHYKTEDPADKNCPQYSGTTIPLDVIRSLKYQGAQESERHYRLKIAISRILRSDPRIDPESVRIEQRLVDGQAWRRPDVQAQVGRTTVAFEAQVSTEMASMIAAREYFYESAKNAAILWVLPEFDPARIRQSHTDILTHNLDHLYALTPELIEHSLHSQTLMLECWIHMPVLAADKLVYQWERRVVRLEEITFKNGHAYVVDTQVIEAELKSVPVSQPAETPPSAVPTSAPELDQEQRFWDRWSALYARVAGLPFHAIYPDLVNSEMAGNPTRWISGLWLKTRGLDWHQVECPMLVMRAIKSADTGNLDWSKQTWKWLTHELCCSYRDWLGPYQYLTRRSGILEDILSQDTDGRIHQAFELARVNRPLSDERRALLKLVSDQLPLEQPPTLSLIDYADEGICYPGIETSQSSMNMRLEFPDWQETINRMRSRGTRGGDLRDVRYRLYERIYSICSSDRHWLPMPNLRPFGDPSLVCIQPTTNNYPQLLERWLNQCQVLEKCLARIESR